MICLSAHLLVPGTLNHENNIVGHPYCARKTELQENSVSSHAVLGKVFQNPHITACEWSLVWNDLSTLPIPLAPGTARARKGSGSGTGTGT